ncbi:GyrI-like domain-containing protein [Heliorestis convoluta]|uniref:GyrI-like domain-containing protein n=1 Tax=Heliorestis convoluta TaxID=356322 RepID=A0A5Q2N204_9FIRM|nr:GyrI-like domain-containing protein [Heliorestis convoluta]QGG48331.1 GyrI-like domain-containing protein [Heliorestis convoluta]
MPALFGKAYEAIFQHLLEIGEKPAGIPFGAYYNMDMDNLDIEIGVPVSKQFSGKGDIQASEIPASHQVSYLYKGPYKDSASVYEAMQKWTMENAYSPTGVVYEFYYNSPLEVPESELLTKIVFLVE